MFQDDDKTKDKTTVFGKDISVGVFGCSQMEM